MVAELRGLVAEHPLRERLWALLMRALEEAGRRAEALEAYAQAQQVIADELGVDPGSRAAAAVRGTARRRRVGDVRRRRPSDHAAGRGRAAVTAGRAGRPVAGAGHAGSAARCRGGTGAAAAAAA